MLQIKGHCSYFGNTGYNIFSRSFFKALQKIYPPLSIRNFTSAENQIVTEDDQRLVDENTAFILDEKIYKSHIPSWRSPFSKFSKGNINIILNETNHQYFYDDYEGIKIAYNLWETTQQPPNFFNKLLEFDQVWVPSKWQKEQLCYQGFPLEKLYVVNGGVNEEFVYVPKVDDGIRRFLIVGSWGFRKGTKEMIQSFLNTFKDVNNVELILSVDNPYSKDGMVSTEQRLKFYGLENSKIKIQHFQDRESYVRMIQQCDVLLACSRGEGWNLPLIEALACGKPCIFSDCSSHTEFASEYPLKVSIEKEIPAVCKEENVDFTGNYYEPNWHLFSKYLQDVYDNFHQYTRQHVELSEKLKEKFSWNNSAKTAMELILPYMFSPRKKENEFYTSVDSIEFLDSGEKSVNHFIYKEIFEYQIYNNIPEMKIKNGDVVVDVGAHIGIFSKYAALQGASKVISMEMEPKYFSCLRMNVRPEDDVFNIVILDKLFTRFKLDNDILIIGFDLNYFYKGRLFDKIDFLKIDIVGKEELLLYSIEKEVLDVIRKISVKLYNISNENKMKLIDYFKNNGFNEVFNILIPNQPIQLLYFWK